MPQLYCSQQAAAQADRDGWLQLGLLVLFVQKASAVNTSKASRSSEGPQKVLSSLHSNLKYYIHGKAMQKGLVYSPEYVIEEVSFCAFLQK